MKGLDFQDIECLKQFRIDFIKIHNITRKKFIQLLNKINAYTKIEIPNIKCDFTEYNNKWKLYEQYIELVEFETIHEFCEIHNYNEDLNKHPDEDITNYYIGCSYKRYFETYKIAHIEWLKGLDGCECFRFNTSRILISEDEYKNIDFEEIAKVDIDKIINDKTENYLEIIENNRKINEELAKKHLDNILSELEISEIEFNNFQLYAKLIQN